MKPITLVELEEGCDAFRRNESRDAMYSIATRLVKEDWGKPRDVANDLGVILLTWNQAAYRYGSFDFDDLERFLTRNHRTLDSFRDRHIETFEVTRDGKIVCSLFAEGLDALAYSEKKKKTPVGVAKALHILAPKFFPLWDVKIARGCECEWPHSQKSPETYVRLMGFVQGAIASLENQFEMANHRASSATSDVAMFLSHRTGQDKTLLKFLDEYLYAKYTQRWI